jgi:hypothetical protein
VLGDEVRREVVIEIARLHGANMVAGEKVGKGESGEPAIKIKKKAEVNRM